MASNRTELKECPECKAPVIHTGSGSTMVGYMSPPPPHDHDDNCVTHEWICENNHRILERNQNYCPAPGCDWKGKTDCFCSKFGINVLPADQSCCHRSNRNLREKLLDN